MTLCFHLRIYFCHLGTVTHALQLSTREAEDLNFETLSQKSKKENNNKTRVSLSTLYFKVSIEEREFTSC